MSGIFDANIALLTRGLDISLTRQSALAGNIANLDTPNYVPRDVDFAAALAEAKRAEPNAALAPPAVVERPDRAPGADGNAVDLDIQMARIAQNATLYQASTKIVSKKLAMLKYVLSEAG